MKSSGRAIAVGGSAGSLAALQEIIPRLPADLPAPVFVVVHVGAHGRDLLAAILDTSGPLRATTARDGEDVDAGRVYVAPADQHLLIINGVIRLGRGPRENRTRPAVDALFRSVATGYRSGAIGLVLTGNLNDGAAGLAAIKQCGGLTAVQNPADAVAPEMPLEALEASDIDYRSSLADLPGLIAALAKEPVGPERLIPEALQLEVEIALGRPCRSETIAEIADVAPLSCPACGGVLSQVRQPPLRFRCQVGHAYTARALAEEQEGSLDEAVRVALRIVEERATLAVGMARDAAAVGRSRAEKDYGGKAAELRLTADVLRSAALRLRTRKTAEHQGTEALVQMRATSFGLTRAARGRGGLICDLRTEPARNRRSQSIRRIRPAVRRPAQQSTAACLSSVTQAQPAKRARSLLSNRVLEPRLYHPHLLHRRSPLQI